MSTTRTSRMLPVRWLSTVVAVAGLLGCGTEQVVSQDTVTSPTLAVTTSITSATTVPDTRPQLRSAAATDAAFWHQFAMSPNWVESYPSIAELDDAADASVVANVVSVEPMEPIPGDVAGSEVERLLVRLEVVIDLSGGELETLELQLETPYGDYDQFVADAASSLPSGSAYFCLRRLTDDGLYRIINGHSVWIQGLDGLEAPLEPDSEYTDRWFGAELSEILTVKELVAYLQARS